MGTEPVSPLGNKTDLRPPEKIPEYAPESNLTWEYSEIGRRLLDSSDDFKYKFNKH